MAKIEGSDTRTQVVVYVYAEKNGLVRMEAGVGVSAEVTGRGPGLHAAWQNLLEDVHLDLLSERPTATAKALGKINQEGGQGD